MKKKYEDYVVDAAYEGTDTDENYIASYCKDRKVYLHGKSGFKEGDHVTITVASNEDKANETPFEKLVQAVEKIAKELKEIGILQRKQTTKEGLRDRLHCLYEQ